MLKLALVMYLLTGPALAGVFVLVALAAPALGLQTFTGIAVAGGAGLLAGLPLAFLVAGAVLRAQKDA